MVKINTTKVKWQSKTIPSFMTGINVKKTKKKEKKKALIILYDCAYFYLPKGTPANNG